ncbi:hypothetical protein AJ78_03995 [Emergomyces pasteurianus Ep9510]|uniref:Uncharacterized protein n=1 Tax=Emergomyces pasteurianus Ep9510 TaxID=1447872 RepID=A0A1J9PH71_9EURO|nr:hypothetical protein AJ78_03995 [Emergomyces pasteurianus Ep9510]
MAGSIIRTIIIAPWAFLILYDLLLYVWRASTYEIPIIGGRARGRQRPQAPSFSERPDGRRRTFSLTRSLYEGQGQWGGNNDGNYRAGIDIINSSSGDVSENESDPFADFGKYGADGGSIQESVCGT